jgi:hypothetical protein
LSIYRGRDVFTAGVIGCGRRLSIEADRVKAMVESSKGAVVKVADALARVDAALLELEAVHSAIKHGSGVQATFPYPHDWNAYEVVDRLEEACKGAAEAARLLSKVSNQDTSPRD